MMLYTTEHEPSSSGSVCDKSDGARRAISQRLRSSGYENVDEDSIAATVDHWFECNCHVPTFLGTYPDTYPRGAIQLKASNRKVQQVLHLLNQPSVPSTSSRPSRAARSAASGAFAVASEPVYEEDRMDNRGRAEAAREVNMAKLQGQTAKLRVASAGPAASADSAAPRNPGYEEDWRDNRGWAEAAREWNIAKLQGQIAKLRAASAGSAASADSATSGHSAG